MLTITDSKFVRDSQPHLIIGGAIHYSRVHPEQWADRLLRLKLMGANTVETYVPWNFHAPAPGVFDFTGARDLGRFLDLAAEIDLDIIVRPGPYVCGEWEGGGFPGWLLQDPSIRLRCMDPQYLAAVDAWFDELIPLVAARLTSAGGRVILLQVENEYGSYGDDKAYLRHLRDGLINRGVDVGLVTSDGPAPLWLLGGTVEGVTPTINFGSRAAQCMEMIREEHPEAPPMCMEFWLGWFDHWGETHHSRDAAEVAAELDTMLAGGMSVNFYVAHGGTNFGMWNGCNYDKVLQPTVTSYDYDAPIAENGALTEKFYAFRDVIARYHEVPDLPSDFPAQPPVLPSTDLSLTREATLTCDALERLSIETAPGVPGLRVSAETTPFPPAFEDLGLERGLLLLRAEVEHPGGTIPLRLHQLRDRAHVFIDGELVGIMERDEHWPESLDITAERGTLKVDILVESLGRINFGPLLGERKGLLRGAWFGTRYIMDWRAFPVALDAIPGELVAAAAVDDATTDGLHVSQYLLPMAKAAERSDGFLDTSDLTRGFAFVGDDMIGRYWNRGPQQSLYIPGPLLKGDQAVVTMVATDGAGGTLRTTPLPIFHTPETKDEQTA